MANDGEYDRGHTAGTIDARLAEHDKHFAQINGSISSLVHEIQGLRLDLQKSVEQDVARDAQVIATAKALKDAVEARRDQSDQRWTPVARVAVILSSLAAGIGVVLAVYANTR